MNTGFLCESWGLLFDLGDYLYTLTASKLLPLEKHASEDLRVPLN